MVDAKLKLQLESNPVAVEFLKKASMDDMLAVANVVNVLNGGSVDSQMSLVDYYTIHDTCNEINEIEN